MRRQTIQTNSGFSTVELLVAMALLILCLTAVLLVSSGSETLLVDSQTSREALSIAQTALEAAQSAGRKDFKSVVPSVTYTTVGSFRYRTQVDVATGSDYVTKTVTAQVTYPGQFGRTNNVSLSGLVTNFNNALAPNTCDTVLTPNADAWKTLSIKNATRDFAALAGVSGVYPITDMDAYNGKLYVTTNLSTANQNTFFVFNISNPSNPTIISKIDNDAANNSGLNAVVVDGTYAYAANASSPSVVGQFQMINLATMAVTKSLKASGVSGLTGAQGQGNSIFYKDGYVYLGLKSTGGHGPEFHIFDVHDASNPLEVGSWPSGSGLGNDINAIYVNGSYAYLATPNSQELIVLNVSNPANITTGSPTRFGYDAAGSGNGKSLDMIGDAIYLGRTNPSSGPEFYILNAADPTAMPALNPTPSTITIGSSVDALQVRSGLDAAPDPTLHTVAFLLTRTALQAYDTSDLSPWTPTKNVSEFLQLPNNGSVTNEPVMDCEGNTLFIGSNDASNKGYLYDIAP